MPARRKQVVSRASKPKSGKLQKFKDSEDKNENDQNKYDDQNINDNDSWLDHLPPVIKADEELHKKLSAERREKRKEKVRLICTEEAESIVNFSLKVFDFYHPEFSQQNNISTASNHNESDNENNNTSDFFTDDDNNDEEKLKLIKKKIQRLKIGFLHGEFIPQPLPPEEITCCRVVSSVSFVSGPQNPPSLQQLLKSLNTDHDVYETGNELIKKALNSDFNFDANPALETFLEKLNTDMKPFTEPKQIPDPVDFPFICCVVGPPCSGKSTVCNFIKKFFNVLFIENNGEIPLENMIHTIVSQLPNLPKGRGVLICNYPTTKQQLTQFEKALQGYLKSKQDNSQQFSQIRLMIRCTMSFDDATKQSHGRLCSTDNRLVFHQTFNPPNVLLEKIYFVTPTPALETPQLYNKCNQATSSFESLSKKGCVYFQVPFLDNINKLELLVENHIRQLYDRCQIPVPFTSFVNFQDNEKLKYAKQCYDINTLWKERCVPLYATSLSDIYAKTIAIKNQIEYLVQQTKVKFSLMLARPDSRYSMSEAFRKNPDDYGEFFKEIWEKSLEVKDNQMEWTSEILNKCGLSLLKGYMYKCEEVIFHSLIQRYLLVEWFLKAFKNMNNIPTNIEEMNPQIPLININKLDDLCTILRINDFETSRNPSAKHTPNQKKTKKSIVTISTVSDSNNNDLQTAYFSQHEGDARFVTRFSFKKEPDDEDISTSDSLPSDSNESKNSHNANNNDDSMTIKMDYLIPRENIIKEFLEFLNSEITSKTMRFEAKLILQIYNFLMNEKLLINQMIDQNISMLQTDLVKWVNKKYSSEMESFAKKLRAFKSGILSNAELFVMDLSFVNFSEDQKSNDIIKSMIDRLGSKIPPVEEPIAYPLEKIIELINSILSLNKETINLSELLECGKNSNFTNDEIDILEIMARMTALPEFIDVKEFIMSLAPDKNAAGEFQCLIQSSGLST